MRTHPQGIKPVVRALAVAFGSTVLLTSAFAQAQSSESTTKLERITVTGSNVKRIDSETVAPVQIITRDQIERSGQPTIADVIRNVPANTGASYGESFSNSFAAGASGISLRGLGQKATLVLINGRRTAGYGFAQNLQDSFVDLNSIPSGAVERIEILKDGASAIYGSDAIAGVVNVILRKDYKGFEGGASFGSAEGKGDVRMNATAGFGDLGTQKFAVMGVLDFFKRDELLFSDTEYGKTRDMRAGNDGGRNFQSLTGGGTWRALTATNGLTNTFKASSGCAANGGFVLTGPQAIAAGLTTSAAVGAATNTFCAIDVNSQLSALPGTQRLGLLSRATFELSPTITGFAELGFSKVETEQTFTAPFFATTGLLPTSVGLRPFSYNINFAPGVAGNPFATNAQFAGSMQGIGLRTAKIDSDTVRFLAGLQYSLGSWDLDSAIGVSRNQVEQLNRNRLSKTAVSSAFGVGTGLQPPTPVSTSSTVNLDNIQSTLAAAQGLFITFPRKAESTLTSFDTRANTTLGELPGGPIGLAVGIDHRSEKLADRPDSHATGGDVLGQGITATDGSRTNTALFGELALPVTKNLEAQLALRSDHYSDYGSSTVPKIGAKWRIADGVLVRGNWGKGFRAPTLPEISPSVATFFIQVNDPVTGAVGQQVSGNYAGNPALKAEKSMSRTLGIVLEPSKNFSIGVDFYSITWADIVGSDSFQGLVDSGSSKVVRDPVTNVIVTINNEYRNLSSVYTQGVDFDVRASTSTPYGKFGASLSAAHTQSYMQEGVEYAGSNAWGASLPKLKASLALSWDNGPWSSTLTVNHTSQYLQEYLAGSYYAPQNPAFQNGVYPDFVPAYNTYDLFLRYRMANSLTVSASVINLTNKMPPYDPGASSTFLYDFTQYDMRGRRVRLGLTYKFF